MTTLKIATWNIYEYDRERRDEAARARYDLVAKVLADDLGDCDVVALQEICGRGRNALERLADASGMFCWWDPPYVSEDGPYRGRVAIAGTEPRPSDFHVGLLWRGPHVRARYGGFQPYPGSGEFWHGLVMQEFAIEGFDRPLHVGSYHGTPFQRDGRPDEARRIVSALTRPYGEDRLAIIGADWNSISADRVQKPDGTWDFWHPDPYWTDGAANVWKEPYAYQCLVDDVDEQGMPSQWHADRRPGEVLLWSGCRDAAALAGAAWTPSVGHFGHADMGDRTIDTHRVSPALAPAVVGWDVISTPTAKQASDHLPVVTTLQLDRLDHPV